MVFPRRLMVPICLLVLLGLLAACASGDASKESPPTPTLLAAVPPTLPAETLHLVIWHSYQDPAGDALAQMQAAFTAAYPTIQLEIVHFDPASLLDEYRSAVDAGAGPDLLLGPAHWIPLLSSEGRIEAVKQNAFAPLVASLTEPLAAATQIGESAFGVPFCAEFGVLYYNRAAVLAPPEMFDELFTQAETHGLLIPPTFLSTAGFYLARSQALMDQAGRVTVDPATLEAYLSDLKKLTERPGITFSSDVGVFTGGSAALMFGSSQDYQALAAALGNNLGVAPLPRLPAQPMPTLITLQVAMQNINSTTGSVVASREFFAFFVSAEAQHIWFETTHRAPVNTLGISDERLRVAWGQMLAQGVIAPITPMFESGLLPVLDEAVRTITLDKGEPAAAAMQALGALPPG